MSVSEEMGKVKCEEKGLAGQLQPMSVWVLTNAPSPYQVELLNCAAAANRCEVTIGFMRVQAVPERLQQADRRLHWKELWSPMPRFLRDEFRLHLSAVWSAMFGRFDCFVLSGLYTGITFQVCVLILAMRGKPWVVWLERPRDGRFGFAATGNRWGSALLRWLKFRYLRFLVRIAPRVIAIGTLAENEYRAMGEKENVVMLPYCCDIERFKNVSPSGVDVVREQYGLSGKVVFLFSGQLVERKGVDILIAAFRRLVGVNSNVALIILGRGPLLHEYEQLVAGELSGKVHFAGFRKQEELPLFFAAADVFVFPSRHDGWGVVVNEACGAGLPVIASRQTGAAAELVREGSSGFVVDCEDVEGFFRGMAYFVENPNKIREFGDRSRLLVEGYSAVRGAQLFGDHVQGAVDLQRERKRG